MRILGFILIFTLGAANIVREVSRYTIESLSTLFSHRPLREGFLLLTSPAASSIYARSSRCHIHFIQLLGSLPSWVYTQVTSHSCRNWHIVLIHVCLVLTYIDVSAAFEGIDENFALYLVSIANACSLFGRLGSGVLADRFGSLILLSLLPP